MAERRIGIRKLKSKLSGAFARSGVEREFERPEDSELGSGKPAPSRGCPSPMGQHDLGLPLFRCDVFDGCPSCARIVEPQIESAEYLERSREQRADRPWIAHV